MFRKTLRRWSAYNQTVRELKGLSNRSLVDLGISREEIRRVARDQSRAFL